MDGNISKIAIEPDTKPHRNNNKSRYALDIKSTTEKFDDFFKRIHLSVKSE